jgi:2-amino-4-hydroxy-6-hydroxymethyldihydropteridine diphosphokinase
MPEALIGIGSNFHPEAAFQAASEAFARRFGAVRWSSVYRSAAEGVAAPDYLNAVALIATARSPAELCAELRAIEADCGRRRVDPAVTELDLDLLFYGQRVDAQQRLPRPGAFTLPFVLLPLAELAPQLVHPVLGATAGSAARRLAAAAAERLGPLAQLT